MNAPTTRNVLSLKRSQNVDAPGFEDRLHKVLANAGLGSRRMLEARIGAGDITVNGKVAEIGSSVRSGDRVELDHKLFVVITDSSEHAQVLLYNKPEGVVATREDPEGRPTIFEQLPNLKGARWISVGRLDINTTGLLLLTTDGALAHSLMHPSTEIEREYICRVHGEVPDSVLEKLKHGIELDDGTARFDEIAVISHGDSHSWFRVVIREGRNREVRRMWEAQGLMVSRLKRIRYGNIELPRGLLRGQSEPLGVDQVTALRNLVGAVEPEPSLTLQPVVNQRRAKSTKEFHPAPNSQQAWNAGTQDEARELRAFDRIRDDGPFRPGGKRKRSTGQNQKPQRGNGPNPQRPGARPARSGKPRGGSGQARQAPAQIGVYQAPRYGEEAPQTQRNRPRSSARGQGNTAPVGTGYGARPRAGGNANPGNGNVGNRSAFGQNDASPRRNDRNAAPRDSRAPRENRFGGGNAAPGNRAPPGQPRGFGQEPNLPRDDIGNRIGPSDRTAPIKPRRPFKPRSK